MPEREVEFVGGPHDGLIEPVWVDAEFVRFAGGGFYWRTDRRTREGRSVYRHDAAMIGVRAKG